MVKSTKAGLLAVVSVVLGLVPAARADSFLSINIQTGFNAGARDVYDSMNTSWAAAVFDPGASNKTAAVASCSGLEINLTGLSGSYLLVGFGVQAPAACCAVSWSPAGLEVGWEWASAVYTTSFGENPGFVQAAPEPSGIPEL